MSYSVNGYTGTPSVPMPPTTAPVAPQPAPVNVPVNNFSPGSLNVDQYMPSAAQAATYTPIFEGAKAGLGTLRSGQAGRGLSKMGTMSRKGRGYSKAVSDVRAGVWGNLGRTVRNSAIVSTVISAALNGYKVYKNEQTVAQAGANITGDAVAGAAGGLAAGAATALGATVLTTMGIAGLPLTLAGIGLGIAGFMAGDALMRRLPAFEQGKTWIHNQLARASG